MKRSGTLGISYQLRSASEGAAQAPAKKRASAVVPSAALIELDVFVILPRVPLRFIRRLPGGCRTKFFNRFAVSPTGPERSCRLQSRLIKYENENKIPVLCSITGVRFFADCAAKKGLLSEQQKSGLKDVGAFCPSRQKNVVSSQYA